MNKKLKTGLIVLIVTALAGSVFYKFYPFSNEKKESDLPYENEDMDASDFVDTFRQRMRTKSFRVYLSFRF